MRSKEVPSTHALEHVLEAGQLEVGPNGQSGDGSAGDATP